MAFGASIIDIEGGPIPLTDPGHFLCTQLGKSTWKLQMYTNGIYIATAKELVSTSFGQSSCTLL